MRLFRLASIASFTLVLSTPLLAQRAAPSIDIRRNVLSINPLGIPFEYVAAEYEGIVSGPVSIGGAFSYFGASDDDYLSLEVKGRLYPNEHAPDGFSIGLAFGASKLKEHVDCEAILNCDDRTTTRPTVHVFVDYNWLLGPTKRFLVGTGVGAKRVMGLESNFFNDINRVYPTVRFQVGAHF
jgi:hypothetical protein